MSQAKTPQAAERERVYQEGQRAAFNSSALCPYEQDNWRHGTWHRGRQAAHDYQAEVEAHIIEAKTDVHLFPWSPEEATDEEVRKSIALLCEHFNLSIERSGHPDTLGQLQLKFEKDDEL